MSCDHIDCGSADKVWLPYISRGCHHGLRPHMYCAKCGTIKSISPDRPHSMEYFINMATYLGRSNGITKVQLRMISKDLEKSGIGDSYGIDRHNQEDLFVEIVKRYFNAPEHVIRAVLC